jgi:hypothetical protein
MIEKTLCREKIFIPDYSLIYDNCSLGCALSKIIDAINKIEKDISHIQHQGCDRCCNLEILDNKLNDLANEIGVINRKTDKISDLKRDVDELYKIKKPEFHSVAEFSSALDFVVNKLTQENERLRTENGYQAASIRRAKEGLASFIENHYSRQESDLKKILNGLQ